MILSRSLKRKKPCSRFPHANAFCTSVHICSRRLRDAEIRHGKYTIARLVFSLTPPHIRPTPALGGKTESPSHHTAFRTPLLQSGIKGAPFRPAFPVPEYRNSCRRLFSDNKQRLITELVLSKKTQAQEPACPSTKFFHPFTNSFTQRKKPKSMDNGHTGHTCIRTPSYPTSFSRPPYQKDKCRYILRAEQRKMP